MLHMRGRWAGPFAAIFLFVAAVGASAQDMPSETLMGGDSQLPVPRFVSLKIEHAHGRRGPGVEQPVQWIYERTGLPLMVTGESGAWRRVRDPDGTEVWMHAQNLDPRRTAIIVGDLDVQLRNAPRGNARIIAYLAPGVIGALTGCEGEWRRIAVGGRVGWVDADALWGAEETCPPQAG